MVFQAADPLDTLKTVQGRCTALHGVPTMFIMELDHPEFSSFDMSTLRGSWRARTFDKVMRLISRCAGIF